MFSLKNCRSHEAVAQQPNRTGASPAGLGRAQVLNNFSSGSDSEEYLIAVQHPTDFLNQIAGFGGR